MRNIKIYLLVFVGLLLFVESNSQVKLPRLISDGMVLQRETTVKIWGWASPAENVSIKFLDNSYSTVANSNGDWHIKLNNLDSGGPFTMEIEASNSIQLNDIYIGDVWVCSGQSNMELPMRRVAWVYPDVIANSDNPKIRHFNVPTQYNFKSTRTDFDQGSWVAATPENVLDFTAVGYFFALELFATNEIPIGLVNSSLGGSPAEAWMSEEALKQFPNHYEELQRFKSDELIAEIMSSDRKRIQGWYNLLNQKDEAYKDKQGPWFQEKIDDSEWPSIQVPSYWSNTDLEGVNGVVWYRKKVSIPKEMVNESAMIILGCIVDADSVFVNGSFVGTTSYQYPPRRYIIPHGILKDGENTIAIRVISNSGNAGFVPDKIYGIVFSTDTIDLAGKWKYKLGASMDPLADETFIRWKPSGLYNAMLAPMLNFSIKGVIWYQGESNAGRPEEYANLFPAMIKNWRKDWKQGDFPFLYVQLANFMKSYDYPTQSNWAKLREAQLKTLSIPNTAMAVTIDIGEWNDIHPLNKKDVGYRLALAAQKVAYGKANVVHSGPIFKSMEIKGNKAIISFTNVGGGLKIKGKELKHFAIAGANKQFVWADAKVKGSKVIVKSKDVKNPVAVRYAWADNPDGANLYNKEGLPASPFRTDRW
jgi:sialate O-acetylesterase